MPILTDTQKTKFIEDGYVVVSGLLGPEMVAETKRRLLDSMDIQEADPATWAGKSSTRHEADVIATTQAARTPEFEQVTAQLVGENFLRGICFSPFLEWNGQPPMCKGYIPVLTFPSPGEKRFKPPPSYHIDGGKYVTTYPGPNFLAVMAYLTDVADFGGTTVVRPGSHRQVFEWWLANEHTPEDPFATVPPLDYADPIPVTAQAGDVCFMHYLMVHSGSENHSKNIRIGMNTAVMPDPDHPYIPRTGKPVSDWTPMDYTLRTDNL